MEGFVEHTLRVPAFGILDVNLDPNIWKALNPLRRVSGGNLSDEEVCNQLAESWIDEKLSTDEGVLEASESCFPKWDGVAACIPSTRVGQQAVLPCMTDYLDDTNEHKFYNTSYNITKRCLATSDPGALGGAWDNYTNYNQCIENTVPGPKEWPENVFLVGYTVSLLSLLLAIFIFIYFRELVCLRHRIHTQLFLSLLATSLTWISSYLALRLLVVMRGSPQAEQALITLYCILHILTRYFQLSIFFWMFVEGLYLFLQVQASFSFGHMRLRHCAAIGWGSPLLLALLWTLLVYCQSATSLKQKDACPLACPFACPSGYTEQLLYALPICALLIANTVFLAWIMGVVISKLHAPSNLSHTSSANLRAAKALVLIVPVLGIPYLVTLMNPFAENTFEGDVFKFLTNVLSSFQGFFISLPYCFCNSEVATMVRGRWERWRTNRDIGTAPQSARNSIATQGFIGVCEGLNRTRSYTYQTVRNSLVPLDRRDTSDSLGRLARLGGKREGGPQPDIVESSRGEKEEQAEEENTV